MLVWVGCEVFHLIGASVDGRTINVCLNVLAIKECVCVNSFRTHCSLRINRFIYLFLEKEQVCPLFCSKFTIGSSATTWGKYNILSLCLSV